DPDAAADPGAKGVPETTVDPDASVEPGDGPDDIVRLAAVAPEIIVGAAPTPGGAAERDGTSRVGAAAGSDGRSRVSSARAAGCAGSAAIAWRAKRRAASRDPL